MDEPRDSSLFDDLATKIARLVEERGWNQEEFAHIALEPPYRSPNPLAGRTSPPA